MKAISLWQPWASLWLSPRKVHETRHWPCQWQGKPMRGTILVHAAKKFVKDFDFDHPLLAILDGEFGPRWVRELPTGALLGTVELLGWVRAMDENDVPAAESDDDLVCGDFSPGRFAWRRGDYRVFKRPIPYRGAQGFFSVADELLKDAA